METGRPVNVKSTANLHVGAQKTFLALAESRTDVSFRLFINDGSLNDIRSEPFDFLRERAYRIVDENAAENLARSYGELVEREFDYVGLTPSQHAAARWGRLADEALREIESRDARRRSPDGQTDSSAEGLVGLAKSKVRPDDATDIFSFNAGLGLNDLLTPPPKKRRRSNKPKPSTFLKDSPMTAKMEPERMQVLNALQKLAKHPNQAQILVNPKALKAFLMISFPSETYEPESMQPDSQESAELATSELEAETLAMEFLDQLTKAQRTDIRTAFKVIHPDCLMLLP